MKEYNLIQAVYMSFYSRKLYKDVANNWGGYAFLYLVFILALTWIYFTYTTQVAFTNTYAAFSEQIVWQMPVIDIKNGVISTPEKRPYSITDPGDKSIVYAIIDTTGYFKELPKYPITMMLVKKTEIIYTPKTRETRIYKLPSDLTTTIRPTDINNHIKDYVAYAWILIFPAALLGSFIFLLLQAIILSLIGKIFSKSIHVNLSYGKILQISMVAFTPALILQILISVFQLPSFHPQLIYFAIAILYMFYGIQANKQ